MLCGHMPRLRLIRRRAAVCWRSMAACPMQLKGCYWRRKDSSNRARSRERFRRLEGWITQPSLCHRTQSVSFFSATTCLGDRKQTKQASEAFSWGIRRRGCTGDGEEVPERSHPNHHPGNPSARPQKGGFAKPAIPQTGLIGAC